jgi:putative inorganic carbon (HCO3(-)) transporter
MEQQKNLTAENKIVFYCDKVIEYGIYALVFFVPLVFCRLLYDCFELPKMVLVQSIIVMLLLVNLIKMRIEKIKVKIFYPVVFFLFVCFISTIQSISPSVSIFGVHRLYDGLVLTLTFIIFYFIFISNIKFESQINNLFLCIILSATLVSIYGILQKLGYEFFFENFNFSGKERNYSFLGNPLFLGSYLSMVIPLSILSILIFKSSFLKLLLTFSTVIIYTSLIFTYSRGAYLGFLISVIFAILIILKNNLLVLDSKKYLLLLLLFCIPITIFVSKQKITAGNRKVNLLERTISTFDTKENAAAARLFIWDGALKIIRDYPLFGTGLDTFGIIYPKYQSPSHIKVEQVLATARKAHNKILQIGTTTGLFGIFSFIWLFISGIMMILNRLKDNPYQKIKIAILCGLISYIVQSQFSIETITTGLLFWVYLGIGGITITSHDLQKEKRQDILKKKKNKNIKVRSKLNLLLFLIVIIIILFYIILIPREIIADFYYREGREKLRGKNAIYLFEKSVKLNPFIGEYWETLGDVYYEKKMWKKAKYAYLKSVKLNSTNLNALFNLGVIYENLQNYDKALKKYESALEISKKINPNDFELYFRLGNLYSYKKNYDEAIRMYEKVIEIKPDIYQAYLNLGNIYLLKGNIDGAINQWQSAISVKNDLREAHWNLAIVYENTNRLDKALEEYKKVLVIEPDNEEVKEAIEKLKLKIGG